MHAFAMAYHEFHAAHDAGPSQLQDLANERESFPNLWQEIVDGRFVVIWNAKLTGDGAENAKYVLAYPKDAEEKGGKVLTAGGTVQELSAEQFRNMPRIGQAQGK
jgi:hypothetical protein